MRLILVVFLVPTALCLTNSVVRPDLLTAVFGNSPAASSVVPVSQAPLPPNVNASETEYIDPYDLYTPALVDYDKFDWSLTKRIASASNENFLISPLGLKLAMAILMEAASGPTKDELASVLGFDTDSHVVRQKFSMILDSLQTKSSRYILNLGSRIYIGAGGEPQQRYAAVAEQFYRTEIKNLDFSDPVLAADTINQWVSNITEGRLPNLVDSGDMIGVAALVLNTLFFRGTWRQQFLPNDTRADVFYLSGKLNKKTMFMNVRSKYYYAESNKYNAKILRMPYLGKKFAMYIVVPNSINGLPLIFNDISGLRSELFYLQETIVDLTLPKFQFEYTSIMDGILKELGIRQAFEDSASFPGLARGQALTQKLKISKVLQRSGIVVNELGSVVYSATEIALENKFGGGVDALAEVVANKPFLFFIQDEATRQLLFTGRVTDPTLLDGVYKH